MISGMELLLQAVERRGNERDVQPGASLPPKKRMKLSFDFDAGESAQVSVAASSVASALSDGSGRAESPKVNSQWTEIAKPQADASGVPQSSGGGVVVPNASARDEKQASGNIASSHKTVKRRLLESGGGKRKRHPSPGVKDVDGNDIGMGYFSTLPRDAPSPSAKETLAAAAAEPAAASPAAAGNPRDADEREGAGAVAARTAASNAGAEASCPEADVASRSLLYRAYLRALLDQAASRRENVLCHL